MKLRSIFIFLIILSISHTAWTVADSNSVCRQYISFEDTNENNEIDAAEVAVVIQNAFENYTRHPSIDRSAFALCFRTPPEDTFRNSNPLPSLSLNSTTGGKPVYIFGLHLNNYQHTLSLSGNQPIYLVDSSLNGCTNCLSINGRAFGVANSQITCSDKENNSIGIKLIGSRHRIETGVDAEEVEESARKGISECTTGIQIGDTGRQYGDFMQIRQSAIHSNGTAIRVVKGTGNKFIENSVHSNDNTGDDIFDANEGIFLTRRQQGDVKKPEIVSSLKNEALGKTFIEILPFYPLNKFEMEVLLTGEEVILSEDPKHSQGKEFYAMAVFKEVKENGNYIFEVPAPETDDKDRVIPAIALFQHKDFGSSSFSSGAMDLNKDDRGILGAFEMESRGEAAGGGNVAGAGAQIGEGVIAGGNDAVTAGAGSDGSEMIGGDSVASTPAAIPPSPDDEDEKGGGDEMSAAPSSPAGDTPAVISGGVDAVGAPGGFGAKGGCGSLAPFNITTTANPAMLVFFAITLATLMGVRNNKKQKK